MAGQPESCFRMPSRPKKNKAQSASKSSSSKKASSSRTVVTDSASKLAAKKLLDFEKEDSEIPFNMSGIAEEDGIVGKRNSASFRSSAMGIGSLLSLEVEEEDGESVGGNEDSVLGQSMLSPTRSSRINEKKQLSLLNDRFATYIERVRTLESENQRLTVQIRSSEETVHRERDGIKAAFDAELRDARRLLDETSKDKARLQIEADKARADHGNLRHINGELEAKIADLEKRLKRAEGMLPDLEARYNKALNEKRHAVDEAAALRKENDRLAAELKNVKDKLAEETLVRVDVENRLLSIREELAFNKNIYEKELEESRQMRQTTITEYGEELEEGYNLRLREQLAELRAQFDLQLRRNRAEIEGMYKEKILQMQDQVDSARDSAGGAHNELSSLRSRVDLLEKERNKYQSLVEGLERKLKDAESRSKFQADDFMAQLSRREGEIRELKAEISRMMTEYQDLMDTKVQLDVEIEAYRRLLEGEESRLNMSTESSGTYEVTNVSSSASSAKRGTKRRRVTQSKPSFQTSAMKGSADIVENYDTKTESKGSVAISKDDIKGDFIQLSNKSDQDESIGGWVLRRVVNDIEVTYVFNHRAVIKAGSTVTVWSKLSGEKHSPPSDLVMKDHQWPVGDFIRTTLSDKNSEEISWRESTHTSASGSASGFSAMSSAEIKSKLLSVESGNLDGDQKCSIM